MGAVVVNESMPVEMVIQMRRNERARRRNRAPNEGAGEAWGVAEQKDDAIVTRGSWNEMKTNELDELWDG